ncbi:MAG: DJ-1/PfpI family protein [Pseudomonadota bacterium]
MVDQTLRIGFVLFPKVTQLDFTGPLQVLSRLPGAETHIAAKTTAPIETDAVLTLNPSCAFEDCPPLDVLCVPGGFGVDDAIRDNALISFVARQAENARYVTSVCTGAFVLGAAGLLRGKRATTHWAYHDDLALVGATPIRERVVRDGNLFTGGGVTAGIDFAFTLAAEIAGEAVAQSIQLGLEYDPRPPFDSGAPDRAAPAIKERMNEFYAERTTGFREQLKALARDASDA